MAILRPFRDYKESDVINLPSIIEVIEPMNNTNEKPMANMSEVVMKKDELLKHLVENKAKHDVILAAAIAGYWDMAKTKVEYRKAKFYERVDEYKQEVDREIAKVLAKIEAKEELPQSISIKQFVVDTNLGLVYPEDHSKDYDRAIRAMQSSIYDTVKLSIDEYDAYVLNNWEWKKNFLAVNTSYANSLRNKLGPAGVKGALGPIGSPGSGYVPSSNPSGYFSSSDIYRRASEDAINLYSYSGCLPNNF